MSNNKNHQCDESCVCSALNELKEQQDLLKGCPTSCFSSLLVKIVKVDTIPFILFDEEGLFKAMVAGVCRSPFFRIEEIDLENCCATLMVLIGRTMDGYETEEICDMYALEKSETFLTVDLTCFCAVQCLDLDLMKRKVIIEPKC
ncbi:spore coat protein [Bacillus timonensis]|nr:spore coat protein [Bacillus timonensis]